MQDFDTYDNEELADNSQFFTVVKLAAISALLAIASLLFFSCNTPKRAERVFDKANRIDHPTVASKCGEMFPPVDSIHEKVVFKEGKAITIKDTIYAQDTTVFNDTVFITKYRVTEKIVHDTLVATKYVQVHNEGKETEQAGKILQNEKKIAKQQKALSISLWALIILSSYTLLRWVLRYWKIKLP